MFFAENLHYYDPYKIRPRWDFCIVLAEERKRVTEGGIVLPEEETGIEKVTEGVCQIIRVGAGEKTSSYNIQVGDRYVYRSFLRFANMIQTLEKWPSGAEKEFFFIAADDLLIQILEGMNAGIFSGPKNPEVMEKTKKPTK